MLTRDGISTTKKQGSFRHEQYFDKVSKKFRFQWDYRDNHGKLHSGVASTLEKARKDAALFGYRGE